jgi:F-type H+-transporting ATPase subunit epsilon
MAEDAIRLEVVTPQKLALSTVVSEVTGPSVEGEFGVLEGHRPLLAALKHGPVKYRERGVSKEAAVGPGFAEVRPHQVYLLVERWLPAAEIDVDEARDDLARAEMTLRELAGQEQTAEHKAARLEAAWAEVRLDVGRRARGI